MSEEEYNNLINLLKLFNNRPYHLARFLIENSAITDVFIENLKDNEKLKNYQSKPVYFSDITEMEDFYYSFIDRMDKLYQNKDIKEVTKDINQRLNKLIEEENYEEAAKVRDYMKRNNIKKL